MCPQFIRSCCQSFILQVCAGTLQMPWIIIIVRFEKQKCTLLKDICVKKKHDHWPGTRRWKALQVRRIKNTVWKLERTRLLKTYWDRNNTYCNQRKLNHHVFTCILILSPGLSYWRNCYDIPYCSGLGFHQSFTLSINMWVVQLL
jgi:hypothetical protein